MSSKTKFVSLSSRWLQIVETGINHLIPYLVEQGKVTPRDPVTLWASEADRLRLLNLRVWRDRHHVSLRFILAAILPFWLNRKFGRRSAASLGVRVSSLAGPKSYQLLTSAIAEAYPKDEHLQSWRSEQIQLLLPTSHWQVSDITKLSASYRRHLHKIQISIQTKKDHLSRQRYRGNPFV